MEEKRLRPLSSVKAGKKARIVRVQAGRGLTGQLTAMGLVPDTEITVFSNGHHGPFVITVRDSKMILGWGMADKIMVE